MKEHKCPHPNLPALPALLWPIPDLPCKPVQTQPCLAPATNFFPRVKNTTYFPHVREFGKKRNICTKGENSLPRKLTTCVEATLSSSTTATLPRICHAAPHRTLCPGILLSCTLLRIHNVLLLLLSQISMTLTVHHMGPSACFAPLLPATAA